MLQAMNTGHDGSICTIHANTTRDALTRIENMVQMGRPTCRSAPSARRSSARVDLIVQVERMRDGSAGSPRSPRSADLEGDVITMNDVFNFEYAGEDPAAGCSARYVTPRIRPGFVDRLRFFGLEDAWVEALGSAG